ncbi:MAG: allophanate hydrolase subunit 1 [Ilumatobacteraceae bacterium]
MLPYGPRAVLAELDSLDEVMATAGAWRAAGLPGVLEIVPAARTVLVVHDGTLATELLVTAESGVVTSVPRLVTIDVAYDGADLAEVAAATGLSIDDVVALHSTAEYTVAFCGFMPGFAYMLGLPTALQLPRRATPRTRVPAGSVAIAAEFTSVYPRESPGGWHLIGSTDIELWDDDAAPPALLTPGTTVRFRPR